MHLLSRFFSHLVHHLGKRNIFVVLSDGSFRGRRENGLFQSRGLLQTARQGDAADLAALAVFFPAGTDEIAAHDAFDRCGIRFFHEHGAAFQLVLVALTYGGELVDIGADEVVARDVFHRLEPIGGESGQDFALVGDFRREDDVEGGNAIGGDQQQTSSQIVNVSHLAFLEQW